MCPICAGEWNAKHTRRRKFGRVLAKAAQLYLVNGGKIIDAKTIVCTAGMGKWFGRSLDHLDMWPKPSLRKSETSPQNYSTMSCN